MARRKDLIVCRAQKKSLPKRGAVSDVLESFFGIGLSALLHPAMGRVPVVFEPKGLGEATGRGAEPSV